MNCEEEEEDFRARSSSLILPKEQSRKKATKVSPIFICFDNATAATSVAKKGGRKTHSLYNLFASGRTFNYLR